MNNSYSRAFSLPEVMIAVAMTLLLFYLLAQSTDAIRKVIKLSRQNADSSLEVVRFFSRLQFDLENRPKRADISYLINNLDPIQKADQYPDTLRFMSEVKNTQENRRLSLVAYRLQKSSDGSYGVYRGVQGYGWQDIGFMGFDANGIPLPVAQSVRIYQKIFPFD